jgi:hypothetical protein
LGIYTKYFSLTIMRNLMIAYKVTKLWKFLRFVEICGTSDPEGALSWNTRRYGFFSNLMTLVWTCIYKPMPQSWGSVRISLEVPEFSLSDCDMLLNIWKPAL